MSDLEQDEIDALLAQALGGYVSEPKFEDIDDFETFLTERNTDPEFGTFLTERNTDPETYGMFQRDVSMVRFFDDKRGESVLADIVRKNEQEQMGNITIPKTNIQLINYSKCPKCDTIFGFKDLMDYYRNPVSDPIFSDRVQQFRKDTRMRCGECTEYFLPTLVIVDGTPKNEVQFLCRAQTIEEIEEWYKKTMHRDVLTRKKSNTITEDDKLAVVNDVLITELSVKPVFVSNLLQYTPADLALSFIEGKNIANKDVLYGAWSSNN